MKNHLLKYLFFTLFNLLFSSLLLNAHAETITGFTQHETVDWLDGKVLAKAQGTDAEKTEALTKFKKHPFWKLLPQNLIEAIEQNHANFRVDTVAPTLFIYNSNVQVMYFGKTDSYYVIPREPRFMSFVGAPERTPAVDPKTNKYYVMPPKNTLAKLTGDELTYVKKLTELVNRNIHYLGSSPIPRLDRDKMERGEYLFSVILPLTLNDLAVQLDPKQEFDYDRRSKTEIMELYGLSDETDADIATRLGVPVYHPEVFAPRRLIQTGADCYGLPGANGYVYEVLGLGWSRFTDSNKKMVESAYKTLYREYFTKLNGSAKLFRKGLATELENMPTSDVRYPAVKSIVTQADKIMKQIESRSQQYAQTADKVYKKLPYSMLDAKGTYLKRFLDQQKKLRESQEKQNKEAPKDISKIAFPRLSRAA